MYRSDFVVDVTIGGVFAGYDAAGVADDDGMGRHVAVDICVRGNQDVVAYGYLADHGRINSYPNFVSYCWNSFPSSPVFLTDCHPFVYVAITPDYSFGVNRDGVRMADIQTSTDFVDNGDFAAIFVAGDFKHQFVKNFNNGGGGLRSSIPFLPRRHVGIAGSICLKRCHMRDYDG